MKHIATTNQTPNQLRTKSGADLPLILMYHSVDTAALAPMYRHHYVTAAEFRWQMKQLKRMRMNPVRFTDLFSAQSGEKPLPPRPVVLTFDDGYRSVLENAHETLCEFGFPYTIFLVSGKIGTVNDWVIPQGWETSPLLNWTQIREMQSSGMVDFHPHSVSHRKLSEMPLHDAIEEMRISKADLEQGLGTTMDVFCYPYGSYNDAIAKAALEIGYHQAVTTEYGRVRPTDDPLRLPRVSVYHVEPFSLTYGIGKLNFYWRLFSRRDKRTPHKSETGLS